MRLIPLLVLMIVNPIRLNANGSPRLMTDSFLTSGLMRWRLLFRPFFDQWYYKAERAARGDAERGDAHGRLELRADAARHVVRGRAGGSLAPWGWNCTCTARTRKAPYPLLQQRPVPPTTATAAHALPLLFLGILNCASIN